MAVVYKWGGIAFDDSSLVKMLQLPADGILMAEMTFHDEAGDDYVVPVGHVFIVGVMMFKGDGVNDVGLIGESDTADDTLTKACIRRSQSALSWEWLEVMGVFTAGKYVTASGTISIQGASIDTTLYGVEVPI